MLKGKNAVITGGVRGIGYAVAEKFCENGANVVLCYRSNDKAAENAAKSLEKYGFVPVVGGHYYTAGKSSCCPVKVTITKITATTIYYKDKSGTPNEKPYHEFMTSSWKDRSL